LAKTLFLDRILSFAIALAISFGSLRWLTLGGMQAIAALADGLFSAKPADIIIGPGTGKPRSA